MLVAEQVKPGAMGKTRRTSKRNHTVAIHGSSAYPYPPKAVQPRNQPLQRT